MDRLTYEQRARLETTEKAANDNGTTLTGDPQIDAHVLHRNQQQPVSSHDDIQQYRSAALLYLYQAPEKLEALDIELAKKEEDLAYVTEMSMHYDSRMIHQLKKEVLTIKEQVYGVYARIEMFERLLGLKSC